MDIDVDDNSIDSGSETESDFDSSEEFDDQLQARKKTRSVAVKTKKQNSKNGGTRKKYY